MPAEIDFASNFFAPTTDYSFEHVVAEFVVDSDNHETGVDAVVDYSDSCC